MLVIFACVHNAGRSQMAAALFNAAIARTDVRATSAGTEPADHVHAIVVDAMKEIGIDLSAAKPQRLTEALARTGSLLITMGCGEQCPVVPGLRRQDWPVRDPNGLPMAEVRSIRDDIRRRVEDLIRAGGWRG